MSGPGVCGCRSGASAKWKSRYAHARRTLNRPWARGGSGSVSMRIPEDYPDDYRIQTLPMITIVTVRHVASD